MKQLIILLLALFSFSFTKAPVGFQPEITSIRFGNGGGFAGIETVYSLNRKGEVHIIQVTLKAKNSTFVKFIGKKEAKVFFDAVKPLRDYQYNAPDNTYSFLEFIGEKTQRIVWGDTTKVDTRVLSLYNNLNTLVK